MEVFTLFGKLAIDSSEALRAIDETTKQSRKIGTAFKESQVTSGKSLKEIAAETGTTVNELRSKVMSLASEYKRQGMSASEATKKAYADVGYKAEQTHKNIENEMRDTSQKIDSELSKVSDTFEDTSGKAENSQSRITSAFKKIGTAVVTYFAVDKIKDFGQACVDASATVAAEQSAFEQIMGDYSDAAQEKISEIADATGMADTRLTPYMTSMTAKFKGLGYDIGDATDYAQQGLTLAADAAAFWDKSLDDSMSALNSFVNGSYEGGEAIGLFANDTQMAAYAVKQGLVSEAKEWSSLDEKIKQATRLEYAENMMKQSGAVGQAAKESGQYANVMANLSESWRQFKAQVGEPILQDIVLPAMDKLNGFIENPLRPGIEKFSDLWSDKLYPAFTKAGKYVGDKFILIFNNLKSLAEKNSDKINTLKEVLSGLFEIVKDGSKHLLDFVEWLTGSADGAERLRSVIGGLAAGFLTYKGVMLATNTAVRTGTKIVEAYRKAQQLLNAASPFGWITLAVSGLVTLETTLSGLPKPTERITEEFAKLDDEEQELIDHIGELTEEYNSWAESRDKAVSDTSAEFDYYQQLADELQTITDKNGEVKKGYEDRAEFIVTTLNDSLGTEIEMTDGVIQKYEEVISAINEVIETKKAEAMLSAVEQDYADAIANVNDAQEAYYEQAEKVNKTKGEIVAVQSALNDLEHMSAEEIHRAYGEMADAGTVSADLDAKLEGLNIRLDDQTTKLNEAEDAYLDYSSTIQNYEGLSSAVISGDTTAINDALLKMTEGFLTAEIADAESLKRQTEDLESQIQSMEQALKKGMPGVTQEQIDQLKELRDQSAIEWGKAVDDAGQAVQDMGGAISDNKGSVTSAAADVASGVKNEMHVDGTDDGNYYMTTYSNGLSEGGQKAIMTVSSLMDTMSRLASGFSVDTSITNVVASAKANLPGHAKGGIVTREHLARVGEDGAEAIVPLERNTEWIDKVAAKVATSMGGAPSNAAVLNKLTELIDVIKNMKVYLDSGTLVGEMVPAMDSALGNISRLKRRGVK